MDNVCKYTVFFWTLPLREIIFVMLEEALSRTDKSSRLKEITEEYSVRRKVREIEEKENKEKMKLGRKVKKAKRMKEYVITRNDNEVEGEGGPQ